MYSNWSYSPETPNLGQIQRFLEPCDLEIWRMTLKNNRAPFLCCFQLCAWFHCHMCIQTGVRVRKRLSWVLTSVTLTFDLWPWPFAWTSLLTMVITLENFMMIQWWEHGEKDVTDRQTDGQTDGKYHLQSCLVAAKNIKMYVLRCIIIGSKQNYEHKASSRTTMNLRCYSRFTAKIGQCFGDQSFCIYDICWYTHVNCKYFW